MVTGGSSTVAPDEKGLARYRQPLAAASSSVWLSLASASHGRHRLLLRHTLTQGRCSHIHLDLLRLCFFGLRDVQRQHAIVIVGLDWVGVYGAGQREAPAERAIGAFDAQIVVLVQLRL